MRFPRFIIGLTTSIALNAQAANVDDYINQLPDGANLALMVQKVGAQAPTIDYHGKQMALPASTQKVITALAALLQLGPDFRFTGRPDCAIWRRSDAKTAEYSQYGRRIKEVWRTTN